MCDKVEAALTIGHKIRGINQDVVNSGDMIGDDAVVPIYHPRNQRLTERELVKYMLASKRQLQARAKSMFERLPPTHMMCP